MELFFGSGNIDAKFYIETYGCQMNIADTKVVQSILIDHGFQYVPKMADADIILFNTCSIRNHAVERVVKRIESIQYLKDRKPHLLFGVLGCIPEHDPDVFKKLNGTIDFLAGPDTYRKLPEIIIDSRGSNQSLNLEISDTESYDDILPYSDKNSISEFISIMRGCNNFCAYCVVPYARGRERSRSIDSINREIAEQIANGVKEVVLIGQNVNSYSYNDKAGTTHDFPDLLSSVARSFPLLRIRFATSHPKDSTKKLFETIASHENISRHLHLPVQSGSNEILKIMKRNYSREWYLDRIRLARQIIPDLSITTDIIAGFCNESEGDHLQTLSLMEEVRFDLAYMFFYSERKGTFAAQNLKDNIDIKTKKRRLQEIIKLQNQHSLQSNQKDIGKVFDVLVEGVSKRSARSLKGRNSQNKMIVFESDQHKKGERVKVRITGCTSATLTGILERNIQ